MHPFSFGERLDALRKAELDQFRAPRSYLLSEFLGVSLWVPPFSVMDPSYYEQEMFTLKRVYRFIIKILFRFDICLYIRFLSSIQKLCNKCTCRRCQRKCKQGGNDQTNQCNDSDPHECV